MHASAKTRASEAQEVEAQEVALQNRFEHVADDGGELPIPMTSEESVPLTVESVRSGQCQNKRGSSVYVPQAKLRKKSETTEKSIDPLRHTAWVTLSSVACSN